MKELQKKLQAQMDKTIEALKFEFFNNKSR